MGAFLNHDARKNGVDRVITEIETGFEHTSQAFVITPMELNVFRKLARHELHARLACCERSEPIASYCSSRRAWVGYSLR